MLPTDSSLSLADLKRLTGINIGPELREWLDSFEVHLKARRWKRATHSLCMLGVQLESMVKPEALREGFEILFWLERNPISWNNMVLEVLNKYPEAKKKIAAYVRQDIKKHDAGQDPDCFDIYTHAKWVLDYLLDTSKPT